jgi:hypothetical protein
MSQGKLFDTNALGNNRPSVKTALRSLLLILPLMWVQVPPAQAQVSVGIGIEVPGVSIGINLPTFPDLQRVPGYPVYYAPDAAGNYFYYDGLYWVLQGDDWYASSWYNGPWRRVMPLYVPAYVLRVPVYYYRQPPPYFRYWRADAPPRWDQHWGREWQQRRPGWDHWDRRAAPPPAPLPTYQRRYPQSRYPPERARQQEIRAENFGYQPREPVSRQAYQLPDRPPSHPQSKPVQRAEPRPAPEHASPALPSPQPRPRPESQQAHPVAAQRPHASRQSVEPQGRGHSQGRAEAFNPGQSRKGDNSPSARSSPQQQGRPDQRMEPGPASAQGPRAQPSSQRGDPNARQHPRQQERGQLQGRDQTVNRRPDKSG